MRAVPRDAARKRSPTPTPRRPEKLFHRRESVTSTQTKRKRNGIPCFSQHHRATRAGKNTKLANSAAEDVSLFPKTLDAAKSEKSATSSAGVVIVGKPKKKRLTTFVFTSLPRDVVVVFSPLRFLLSRAMMIFKEGEQREKHARRGVKSRKRAEEEEEVAGVGAVRAISLCCRVSLFPQQQTNNQEEGRKSVPFRVSLKIFF
jgi:hypothetical protein